MGASSHDDAPCQLFEIAGPGGVAMMVEAMGQDRKQLVPSIRYCPAIISHLSPHSKAANYYDATIQKEGALAWMFDKKGVVGWFWVCGW